MSISRVTPAGSVSSIGWRGPNAGCGRGTRCSAETGTVGACPTVAANAGPTRIFAPTPGFVSSCDGGGCEAGATTAGAGGSGVGVRPAGRWMTTVRSSGVTIDLDHAACAPEDAGVVGTAGWIANGSISSVSGRCRSLDVGSRLVSPAGSSMGSGGT